MRRGVMMDSVITKKMTANKLSGVIKLPKSFSGKKVEVIVRVVEKEPVREGIVDKLYGCASNLNLSAKEIRAERRNAL